MTSLQPADVRIFFVNKQLMEVTVDDREYEKFKGILRTIEQTTGLPVEYASDLARLQDAKLAANVLGSNHIVYVYPAKFGVKTNAGLIDLAQDLKARFEQMGLSTRLMNPPEEPSLPEFLEQIALIRMTK